MRIKPFSALRPTPELAEEVASPPYDVLNSDEARDMAKGHPHTFLHVIKPEIDLPQGTDLYSDEVYEKARENFERLVDGGALIREQEPRLYLYAQRMGDHEQCGIVACCHIDDYENNIIKKHEHTRRQKEDDRTRHVATLNANAGPVFLTFRDSDEVAAVTREIRSADPLYDFIAPDGVQHSVWSVSDPRSLMKAFGDIPTAYVADGHHRSASAVRVGRERRDANPDHTGEEEYNWYLAVLFPASELNILPYNRVVKDLNGLSKEAFLGRVAELFEVAEDASPRPSDTGSAAMYLDGRWYGLRWTPPVTDDPVTRMDVSVLQDRLLGPVLGIGDPRKDERIDFVGGIRGTDELERRVDAGEAVAFSMYPVTVEQLMAVADAGKVMPPKSTWFEPKLRSGLLVHTLD